MKLSAFVIAQTISSWWSGFATNWNWQDPTLLVALISMMFTGVIPVVLWRLGAIQTKTDTELLDRQAASLARQERIVERHRRDSLMRVLAETTDEAYLRAIWKEIGEFPESDQKLLKSIIRTNPKIRLPGSNRGLNLWDKVDQAAVDDYLIGLERRYGDRKDAYPFRGLLDFLRVAARANLEIDTSLIVKLVIGKSAAVELPTHMFFKDLVLVHPPCAAHLLFEIEGIDSRTAGGLKLNVLTGVFWAVKTVADGKEGLGVLTPNIEEEFRRSIPSALAQLMHRVGLRSFEKWSYDDSSQPVSATVAWLIRAVGYFADTEDHLALRMVENLEAAISSIPIDDRSWGVDDKDVREGFNQIRVKQPALWSQFGVGIEKAASEIGVWRS